MLDRIEVLTRIVEKIKRFPVTFELMKEWTQYENIGISDRTLYRYLKETEQLTLNDGRIITFNGDCNKKTWKFEYYNSHDELSEDDILSLQYMKEFFPKSFLFHYKESVEKIEKIIYKSQSKSKFEYYYHPASGRKIISTLSEKRYTPESVHIINQAFWSIIHQRKIHICYKGISDNQNVSVLLCPMQFVFHKEKYFLVCLTEQNMQLFAVDTSAIRDIEITNSNFDYSRYEAVYNEHRSKRFGFEPNVDDNVYEIILLFNKELKERICDTLWHPTQQLRILSDGRVELILHCGINTELIQWILQWNAHVEITAPNILSQSMRDHLLKMLYRYEHIPCLGF